MTAKTIIVVVVVVIINNNDNNNDNDNYAIGNGTSKMVVIASKIVQSLTWRQAWRSCGARNVSNSQPKAWDPLVNTQTCKTG